MRPVLLVHVVAAGRSLSANALLDAVSRPLSPFGAVTELVLAFGPSARPRADSVSRDIRARRSKLTVSPLRFPTDLDDRRLAPVRMLVREGVARWFEHERRKPSADILVSTEGGRFIHWTALVEAFESRPHRFRRLGVLTKVTDGTTSAFRVEPVVDDPRLVCVDSVIEHLCRLPSGYPVLLTGPTGSGKSFAATKLHDRWVAELGRNGAFVQLNCAALPRDLAESELFGYERGSHGTATTSSAGLVERAGGGTLFLDEIGELPLSVQAKLLVALDSDESGGLVVRRLGAAKSSTFDVRLVLGTNRDLHSMVGEGRFRLDLFGRIKTHTIVLPALPQVRHRILPAYIAHLQAASRRYPGTIQFALTPKAHQLLRAFASAPRSTWIWNYRDVAESAHQLTYTAFRRGNPTKEGVHWVDAATVEAEIERLLAEWARHEAPNATEDEWAPLDQALEDGTAELTVLQRQEALWLLRARQATPTRAAAWRWLVEKNVYHEASRKVEAKTPDTVRFDARWKKFRWRR